MPGPATRPARTQTQAPLNQGLVFCDEQGRALDNSVVTKRLQRTLVKAGLPAVNFHSFRHGAASLMIESGMSLAVVSRLMGHANIGITVDVYGHITQQHEREAMARFAEKMA